MKKSLLFLSASVLACGSMLATPFNDSKFDKAPASVMENKPMKAPAFAEGEQPVINFGYAGEPVNCYALNTVNSGIVYVAFQIPVEDLKPYIGCQISGIQMYSPVNSYNTNPVSKVVAFVTDDITKIPTNKISASISSKGLALNDIDFTTPFEITGDKPLYVGYNFKYVSNLYYLPVDEILTPASKKNCLVGNAKSISTVPTYANYSNEIGSVCITAKITGENLPNNLVQLRSMDMTSPWFAPNADISYENTIYNVGANDITSVSVKSVLSNGKEYEKTINLSTPLPPCSNSTFKVDGFSVSENGIDYTVTTQLTKVNGTDVDSPVKFTSQFSSYPGGIKRRVVLEEATGNWCGYCPRGIVMMEYLKEKYPEWIRIGVHSGQGSVTNEPMGVPNYSGWVKAYVTGFPSAVANRAVPVSVAGSNDEAYAPVNKYFTSFPAYADMTMELNVAEDGQSVDISSNTRFALDLNLKHNVSFVIVEDNVGPYSQENYFYGENAGLGEWDNIESRTKVMFNDVARALSSYPGVSTPFPTTVEANVDYPFTLTMPLAYSYGKNSQNESGTVINSKCFRVVGLITNANTGEIVNACQVSVGNSAVENIADDLDRKVTVSVQNGNIVVAGTDNYAVYTLDGRNVSANNVAPGIYIVNAEGKAVKILVK